jgi:hypothetical protein
MAKAEMEQAGGLGRDYARIKALLAGSSRVGRKELVAGQSKRYPRLPGIIKPVMWVKAPLISSLASQ